MPEVSVIMNCLNGERYLKEAVDSVFAQSFQDWEIIFWDNASTDSSPEIAQSYGDRVRYFRSDVTYSLGKARNLAISRASGEYIALLDCDDVWLPEKLERQLCLLRDKRDIAMCFSNSMFFNSRGDLYDHFSQSRPKRGMIFEDLLRDNFISSETMVFRKGCFYELEYVFDEQLTMVMDYDLSLRVAYRYPLDYIEDVLSKWRAHEGSESSSRRFLIPRENELMLKKLIANHPDMMQRYRDSVSVLRDNINYQLGLERWSKREVIEARSMLKRCRRNRKVILAYLASYFIPFPVFDTLKSNLKTRILGGLSCKS